jgi:hypothetical protein
LVLVWSSVWFALRFGTCTARSPNPTHTYIYLYIYIAFYNRMSILIYPHEFLLGIYVYMIMIARNNYDYT